MNPDAAGEEPDEVPEESTGLPVGELPKNDSEETIELDRFLKLSQITSSGGEAKQLIRSGAVRVNGVVETRRGRKLRHGDRVEANGEEFVIETDAE